MWPSNQALHLSGGASSVAGTAELTGAPPTGELWRWAASERECTMNIGILGTGMVGQAIGSKLIQLGHEVRMGSRTENNEKAAQ